MQRLLPNIPGPYSEVPSDTDAEKPRPAMENWRSVVPNWVRDNPYLVCCDIADEGSVESDEEEDGGSAEGAGSTDILDSLVSTVMQNEERMNFIFCNLHQSGFFCDGLARICCYKQEDSNYAKCGSTANCTFCAAQ